MSHSITSTSPSSSSSPSPPRGKAPAPKVPVKVPTSVAGPAPYPAPPGAITLTTALSPSKKEPLEVKESPKLPLDRNTLLRVFITHDLGIQLPKAQDDPKKESLFLHETLRKASATDMILRAAFLIGDRDLIVERLKDYDFEKNTHKLSCVYACALANGDYENFKLLLLSISKDFITPGVNSEGSWTGWFFLAHALGRLSFFQDLFTYIPPLPEEAYSSVFQVVAEVHIDPKMSPSLREVCEISKEFAAHFPALSYSPSERACAQALKIFYPHIQNGTIPFSDVKDVLIECINKKHFLILEALRACPDFDKLLAKHGVTLESMGAPSQPK